MQNLSFYSSLKVGSEEIRNNVFRRAFQYDY